MMNKPPKREAIVAPSLCPAILDEMIREQLAVWPLAAANYAALVKTERRPVMIGPMRGALQCNPARVGSTVAKVDKSSLAGRPCFLCAENRPKEQLSLPFGDDWEILVNPYPILPFHFTVASSRHTPQADIPLAMIELAEKLPGAVVFFNGAGAGASAPDHAHMQIVLKEELPLIRFLESVGTRHGASAPQDALINFPYAVEYSIVNPDQSGMLAMARFVKGARADALFPGQKPGMVNAFAWIGADGRLRLLSIPRRAHRPQCFYAEGDEKMLVSPGSIDMAGLVILPRREDFDRMTEAQLEAIYSQVGLPLRTHHGASLQS